MTPAKYKKLFGELSAKQREIINDKQSKYIVVAAGPGSGKTRVLVHKLASLLLMEDVKHEQLLMLTFSRAAATEFKQRLIDLIGNAAYFVEIKTFHSFAFDLLGKTGNLEDAEDVVAKAAQLIESGEAEQGRINKAVLVIDEAARIVGLLLKHNVNAKLIQSADGFRFGNLAEIRYFLKLIDKDLKSPIISEDCWQYAKQKTVEMYRDSSCMDYVKEFFAAFERVNNIKYRSDLADFVFESELEDFCGEGAQTIFVSTIHKSKGREFDTVYMLLSGINAYKDEDFRRLYVGMTRAKKNLYIHCNTDIFTQNKSAIDDFRVDNENYPVPMEITLQLTHKDVYLGFFKDKKKQILMLRAGQSLSYKNGYLKTSSGEDVAYLSKQKRAELKDWEDKGYNVQSARINYILAWKGKDDEEETAVLLPELILKKSETS